MAGRLTRIAQRTVSRLAAGALGVSLKEALARHPVVFGDRERLTIAESAVVNDALFNCESGTIRVEDHAFFGHGVSVLTGTHDIQRFGGDRKRAIPGSGRDVVIEEGAWISSNATVLGPARIGRHAVVAAGAVVVDDVAPYTVVAGVPARPVRAIAPAVDDS
jgi:acetyltransferase-like isoleucine patch superfamily enzyme